PRGRRRALPQGGRLEPRRLRGGRHGAVPALRARGRGDGVLAASRRSARRCRGARVLGGEGDRGGRAREAPPEIALLGIIGGSGLYQLEGLERTRWERVPSPFGEPSDALLLGELEGAPVAFL